VLVTFELKNDGSRAGDEVAQLYARKTTASVATPQRALRGFRRVHLEPGESRTINLRLKQADLAVWDTNRQWTIEPGEYTVTVGGSSAGGLSMQFVVE
jgi:beta-glucosidase